MKKTPLHTTTANEVFSGEPNSSAGLTPTKPSNSSMDTKAISELADALEADCEGAILNLTPKHCRLIVESLRNSAGATNSRSASAAEYRGTRATVARILAHKMPSLRVDDLPGKYAHAIADEVIATLALSSPHYRSDP